MLLKCKACDCIINQCRCEKEADFPVTYGVCSACEKRADREREKEQER